MILGQTRVIKFGDTAYVAVRGFTTREQARQLSAIAGKQASEIDYDTIYQTLAGAIIEFGGFVIEGEGGAVFGAKKPTQEQSIRLVDLLGSTLVERIRKVVYELSGLSESEKKESLSPDSPADSEANPERVVATAAGPAK